MVAKVAKPDRFVLVPPVTQGHTSVSFLLPSWHAVQQLARPLPYTEGAARRADLGRVHKDAFRKIGLISLPFGGLSSNEGSEISVLRYPAFVKEESPLS